MEQIIQQLSINEKNTECLESDSKTETILHLAMVRDIYLGEKGEDLQKSECSADSTERNTEDECSVDEVLSKSKNYGMTWCTFTKQSEITSVCQSILKDNEGGQLLIQSLGQTIIHRGFFYPRRAAYVNMSTCDKMTIYYYKSNLKDERRGRPVVLNFSGSDQFLKCMYDKGKAVLTVECWEKDKLKSICKNDKTTWPFVFFLSTTKDNLYRFESAACSGWFIHTGCNLVYACNRLEEKVEESTFSITSLLQLL